MPKVKISTVGFETFVIDAEPELVAFDTVSVSRVVDGHVAVTLAESDTKMNSVINVQDTVYNTTYTPTPTDEELTKYTKRTDFVGDDVIYTGEAAVGSLETNPVWRIFKIEFVGVDGDVKKTWADGSDQFTKTWAARASYTYL